MVPTPHEDFVEHQWGVGRSGKTRSTHDLLVRKQRKIGKKNNNLETQIREKEMLNLEEDTALRCIAIGEAAEGENLPHYNAE